MKPALLPLSIAFALVVAGCGEEATVAEQRPATRPAIRSTPASERPRVVFLGDSLTAGYGLDESQAFPALLSKRLADDGLGVDVVNAGVSGDTTAGGLGRLDWLLRQQPDVLVVGLGGNDGLRGVDVAESERNLREIVTIARDAGVRVLLLGMLIPPNYGVEYTSAFRDVYPRVASDLGVPLVPFLLEGVGGDPALNQGDGIHPTAAGQEVVAGNVLPFLRPLVMAAQVERAGASSP